MSIEGLTVDRFIVQEVPRRREDVQLVPTEIETEGDEVLHEHIRSEAVKALLKHKLDVRFSGALSPTTHDIVEALLTGNADLIEASQDLQRLLYTQQDGRASAGVLVVVLAHSGSGTGVAMIKAEARQGVRLEPALVDQRRRYTVEHIRDLVFTGDSRFYKIAFFERSTDGSGELVGYHADLQLSTKGAGVGTDYFLSRFLGCVPAAEPANVIARVWDTAVRYFNTIDDAPARVQYMSHLQSAMANNRSRFVADDFTSTHLEPRHQDGMRRALIDQDIDPAASHVKDTSRITNRIKKMRIAFQSGLNLVGTTESIDQHVHQEADENGAQRTVISDTVTDVDGSR